MCREKINLEQPPFCRGSITAILHSPSTLPTAIEEITAVFFVLQPSTLSKVDIIVSLPSVLVSSNIISSR